jgi:hypothetical protein
VEKLYRKKLLKNLNHTSVSDCGHGNRSPPERGRNRRELGLEFLLLSEVGQARKQQNTNGQKHHEHAELFVALLERVAERLQAGRVPRQLEYTQYSQDSKHLNHTACIVKVLVALIEYEQREKVGQDGDQVDHVQTALEELPLVGCGPKAQQILESEPSDAERLHRFQVGIVVKCVVYAIYGHHAATLNDHRTRRSQEACVNWRRFTAVLV